MRQTHINKKETHYLIKHKHKNINIKLYLCESYFLPVLSYAIEILQLCTAVLRKFNAYWNSVYRKSFPTSLGNQ